jgi:hypothetical protein
MRNVSDNVFPKIVPFHEMEKYDRARQATDDTARALSMLG